MCHLRLLPVLVRVLHIARHSMNLEVNVASQDYGARQFPAQCQMFWPEYQTSAMKPQHFGHVVFFLLLLGTGAKGVEPEGTVCFSLLQHSSPFSSRVKLVCCLLTRYAS